jgi:hypothetical protein
MALAAPAILGTLEPVYVAMAERLEVFLLFNLARAGLAFLVFLVPTLMGGTVPVLSRYLVTRAETVGERRAPTH